MNIFTKKYFIVLFILPFIGINVIDGNILLSSASKMVVSIIGYLMLFENFNYNKNILNIKLILLVMLYSFIILFSAVINNNITMGMIYTNFVYIGFIIYINYCMKDFKNFINAFIGALIFSIPAIILYMIGYLSSVFFMLVPYGAILFYKKSSGQDIINKKYIIWITALISTTIISFILFPYLISITQDIKLRSLLNSPKFMTSLTSDYLYSLIFTITGAWTIIKTESKKIPFNEEENMQKVIEIYHKYNALSKENSVSEIKIAKEIDIQNKYAYFASLEKRGIIVSPFIKSYLDEEAITNKEKAKKNRFKNLSVAVIINTIILLITITIVLIMLAAS